VPAEWKKMVDASVLRSLPESEINRQSIIYNVINKESKYVQDLDIVQSVRPRGSIHHLCAHTHDSCSSRRSGKRTRP
jgi:hypothetical protein